MSIENPNNAPLEKGSEEETQAAQEAAYELAEELGFNKEEDSVIFEKLDTLHWDDDKGDYVLETPGGEKTGVEDWLKSAGARLKEKGNLGESGEKREENEREARMNSGHNPWTEKNK